MIPRVRAKIIAWTEIHPTQSSRGTTPSLPPWRAGIPLALAPCPAGRIGVAALQGAPSAMSLVRPASPRRAFAYLEHLVVQQEFRRPLRSRSRRRPLAVN